MREKNRFQFVFRSSSQTYPFCRQNQQLDKSCFLYSNLLPKAAAGKKYFSIYLLPCRSISYSWRNLLSYLSLEAVAGQIFFFIFVARSSNMTSNWTNLSSFWCQMQQLGKNLFFLFVARSSSQQNLSPSNCQKQQAEKSKQAVSSQESFSPRSSQPGHRESEGF